MFSPRAGFVTVLALMTLFPAVVGVTAAVNGWHPRGLMELRCPGYMGWEDSTIERMTRAEALVDELNSKFRWSTPWENIESQFKDLADEQESTDVPPALSEFNNELVGYFEIFERDARGRKNGNSASPETAQKHLLDFNEKHQTFEDDISSICGLW